MSATKKTAKAAEKTPAQIIAQVQENPGAVLTDSALWAAFIKVVEDEATSFKADVSTEAGREVTKARAYRLVKYRTSIEKARKDMTEEWRVQTNTVNTVGKIAREKLEALQKQISAPLDAWEAAEKAKQDAIQETIARLRLYAGPISAEDTPDILMDRLNWVRGLNDLNEEQYGEWLVVAENEQRLAIAKLSAEHTRLVQEAKDREDLARLRAAEAEAQAKREREAEIQRQAEHDAKVAREAAEKATRDQAEALERAEQQRLAAEAEAERLAAQREADRKAAIRRRIDAITEPEGYGQTETSAELRKRVTYLEGLNLDEFQEFAAEAWELIVPEITRTRILVHEAEQREAAATAAREEEIRQQFIAAQRAKEAAPTISPTIARARKVNRDAAAAIHSIVGCAEVTARAVVIAIAQGKIPGVTISYS